jgi:hypothetical protein
VWQTLGGVQLYTGSAIEPLTYDAAEYQDIPELYGKPLKIVCVANQEYEFTNGKTKYFGENITKKTLAWRLV